MRTCGKKYLFSGIALSLLLLFSMQGCSSQQPAVKPAAAAPKTEQSAAKQAPEVFMTSKIDSKSLFTLYQKLNTPVSGKTMIKLHMGERGNSNYISPELVRELVLAVNGAFADSNVYYSGARSTTAGHLEVAREHGFTFAPVDILDADGSVTVPIKGGNHLKEAILGSHFSNYDWIISVAHFKGHALAGFGGAFKNISVGIASPQGKGAIHSSSGSGAFSSTGNVFLEKVAEYAKGIIDAKGGKMLYINILNNLSVDCDCDAGAAHPSMPDIGILASTDPVALEKASLDMIYSRPAEERKHLAERIESRNGKYLLDYAEKIGIGSQKYTLVKID